MPTRSAIEAYEAGYEQGQEDGRRRREEQARREFDVAVALVIHCAALGDSDRLLGAARRLAAANVALRDAGDSPMLEVRRSEDAA